MVFLVPGEMPIAHAAGFDNGARFAFDLVSSRRRVSMEFERHIGVSPKGYLNRRLNQEACQLLLNTNWRIKEVAQKLAFADEFYFSRFISKMNAISPGKYRRMFDASSPLDPTP